MTIMSELGCRIPGTPLLTIPQGNKWKMRQTVNMNIFFNNKNKCEEFCTFFTVGRYFAC